MKQLKRDKKKKNVWRDWRENWNEKRRGLWSGFERKEKCGRVTFRVMGFHWHIHTPCAYSFNTFDNVNRGIFFCSYA